MSAPSTRPRGIDSVEVAGRLLQACLRLGSTFRLKDLEAETGIASATIYRYLVSLGEVGLIQRTDGSRYTLGLLAFQLGQRAAQNNDTVSLIAPQVARFGQQVGETCAIGVWYPSGATIVKWFELNRDITISLRLGAVLPLLSSSTARVFGAYLPREATESVLRSELVAARDARSTDDVYDELASVRRNGLAQGRGRHIAGISSLSAPVFGPDGTIALAISIIGNQATFDASLKGAAAQALRQLCTRLSAQLGAPER